MCEHGHTQSLSSPSLLMANQVPFSDLLLLLLGTNYCLISVKLLCNTDMCMEIG